MKPHLFIITRGIHSTDEIVLVDDPPRWLSQGDMKWFWNEHVLTLNQGESVETDFSKITRVM